MPFRQQQQGGRQPSDQRSLPDEGTRGGAGAGDGGHRAGLGGMRAAIAGTGTGLRVHGRYRGKPRQPSSSPGGTFPADPALQLTGTGLTSSSQELFSFEMKKRAKD